MVLIDLRTEFDEVFIYLTSNIGYTVMDDKLKRGHLHYIFQIFYIAHIHLRFKLKYV